jgi:tetratricopeptide (TPR) repeat protein
MSVANAADPSSARSSPMGTVTVFGPANVPFAEGATALREGRVEEGLRLTLEGLETPNAVKDAAAGHANACAAYALLERWEEALFHCNTSLRLDDTNWRTYNNRAAVYAGTRHYDLALRDIESGLEIAPRSPTLRESLRVVSTNQRLMRNRGNRELVRERRIFRAM